MRSRIFLTVLLAVLFVILSGCGTSSVCPTCGTTKYGAYANIDVIPVPEHNPTGEPGGPFNSFDISSLAPNPASSGRFLDYISDRIGVAIVVIDTEQDLALDVIQGSNAVSDAGNGASPCPTVPEPGVVPATNGAIIPPIIDVFGNFTRYGCRDDVSWESTAALTAPKFHLNTGFGANNNFGGFPGAQCCASRANGVNPMSGPDGNTTTADGKVLFVGNGSSSVVVFDLTTMNLVTSPPTPPTILATIPTGVSADYDGPLGIAGCIASWNGEAGSAADCGDDRADEMAYDDTHHVLAVINGDPGLPFITFIDMTNVVGKTGTQQQQHCLPIDSALAYGPYPAGFTVATSTYPYLGVGAYSYPLQGTGTGIPGTGVDGGGNPLPSPDLDPGVGGSFNPPSCIVGQIYYDGAGGPGTGLTSNVPVDTVGGAFPCPDPSNPHVFSGVSGSAVDVAAGLVGIGTTPSGTAYSIPCHHGPVLNYSTGAFCSQTNPATGCAGAIAPAGLGGMTYEPNTDRWLLTNENSVGTTNIGSVDVIDLQLATGNGPVVVNSYPMLNCMPTGITQGPGDNFLVGCADHDGEAFPPNEYIITGSTGAILTQITDVGGVDETWYNPGDNRYYLAARDMPTGAVLGVIDAGKNLWLTNVATGSNSHSVAVDPSNNHVFVPMQAGAGCTTQSANGCVAVYAQQ